MGLVGIFRSRKASRESHYTYLDPMPVPEETMSHWKGRAACPVP